MLQLYSLAPARYRPQDPLCPGNSRVAPHVDRGHHRLPPADDVESGPVGNVVGVNTEANEICAWERQPPSPTKPGSETVELHTRIKRILSRPTLLPDSVSALVAFWVISNWFQDAFTVFPCLVVTGPAHEAMVILRVLNELCHAPILLAGFKRADLKDLNRLRTLLISEQNLDARTAALLGNLTNRGFALVEQGSYLYCTNCSSHRWSSALASRRRAVNRPTVNTNRILCPERMTRL
jgi:hypothetical protein